eukprot:EG_transcript_10353
MNAAGERGSLLHDQPPPLPGSSGLSPSALYVTLATLWLLYLSGQWSRQLITYLCDFTSGDAYRHMNAALHMSQREYALLAGVGFTAYFAAVSLVAGSLATKMDRKAVTVASAVAWGTATACQAACPSVACMVVVRAVQGVAQAFCTPAAYTLISDLVPKGSVAFTNGVYGSAVYFGGALASLAVLLDNWYGWRHTSLLVGAFCLVAAAGGATLIRTPASPGVPPLTEGDHPSDAATTPALETPASTAAVVATALADVGRDARTVLGLPTARLILLATGFQFCAGFSIGVWKAPFIFQKFPEHAAAFSSLNAGIITVGGFTASLSAGFVADRCFVGRRRLLVPAVGSLLAAPLFAAFVLHPSFHVALVLLFAEYLVAEGWVGPTLAALFGEVPDTQRGSAQGLFSTLTAFGTLAPVVVSALATVPGGSLDHALLGVVCVAYLVASLLFATAALAPAGVSAANPATP